MTRIRNAGFKKTQQEWHQRNVEHMRNKQNEQRDKIKKWLREDILGDKSCIKCGENHIGCLDFHHRDPSQKELEVTKMAHKKYGKDRILQEISKCDILCANCHRKLHWEQQNGV